MWRDMSINVSRFIGVVKELPKEAMPNDICILDGEERKTYIYLNSWLEVYSNNILEDSVNLVMHNIELTDEEKVTALENICKEWREEWKK
jgi:hypothetical protein